LGGIFLVMGGSGEGGGVVVHLYSRRQNVDIMEE
jgi:hypothetical protein